MMRLRPRRSDRVRPLAAIPLGAWLLLAVGLAVQLAWHAWRAPPEARARDLPPAPGVGTLRVVSLGEERVLAKLLMLWLQAFDNQPGISIPFRDLDYDRVEAWLGRILALDPRGQYPLLAASRLYGTLPVPAKQRQMLNFVYREFFADPDRRWPWLAHAALIAKHRLKDLPLALRYATAISEHATGPGVPYWARDLRAIILEDMGELEAAKVLIGGLLANGRITDRHELRFLTRRLEDLERKTVDNSTHR